MGANFQTMKVQGDADRAAVTAKFVAAQEQDRYENGHSYSGGIGMADGLEFRDETFKTVREARDWLDANAQKWEEALAVRVEGEEGKCWLIGAVCAS
jgi:hypothetical protein